MKKIVSTLLAFVMILTVFTACDKKEEKKDDKKEGTQVEETTVAEEKKEDKEEKAEEKDDKKEDKEEDDKKAEGDLQEVDTLSIYFVPSREPDEIVAMTEPLKELIARYFEEGLQNSELTQRSWYQVIM